MGKVECDSCHKQFDIDPESTHNEATAHSKETEHLKFHRVTG